MPAAPNETDSPLVVNPDGVLSLPVTAQSLKLVSWRRCQNAQFRGSMQLQKLPQRHTLEGPKAPGMLIMKEFLGLLRREALNHTRSILRVTLYVN